jgi:hypothetical protein
MLQNNWESLRQWLLGLKAIGEEIQTPTQISRLDLSNKGLNELSESIFYCKICWCSTSRAITSRPCRMP